MAPDSDHIDAADAGSATEEARVAGKDNSQYYLKTTPWGPRAEEHEITVSRSQYERAVVGSRVDIFVRDSWLGAAWYYVRVGPPPRDG